MAQVAHLMLVDDPGDLSQEWERNIVAAERAMRRLVRVVAQTRADDPGREMELHQLYADRLSMIRRYGQAVGW